VDGIGVVLNYDEAYDDNIRRAREAGIGVIAFNIDDTKRGEGSERMAYIGQDMEEAGRLIAARLVQEGGLSKGDFVACPVETPDAVYAIQRYAGVRSVLEEHGIDSEVIATGTLSLEDTLNKLTQFLIGHAETDAICAMGQMPMEASPQAAEDADMAIPIAGFDISKQIARNIQEGRSIATVDQQPFYQGLLTVTQLYYYSKYGLSPCDINTGGAMVDASNVEQVMTLADTVR
jgi:simple sugar transport system substrate-binding protein